MYAGTFGFVILEKEQIHMRLFGLIALGTLLACASATAQQEMYKSIEVAEGVYSFGGGPFAYYTMFVVSDDGVLVADPVNPDLATAMIREIRSITTKPIRYVVYSHNHWDHISGGQVFKDAGAVVISHVEAKDAIRANPNVIAPDRVWAGNRFDIAIGNKTIQLHYFGANHGDGMTVMLLPEEQVLFTADLVVPERVGFMFMPDFSPQNWIRTLKEMEGLQFQTALFAHDHPVGTKQHVIVQREYLEDLTAAVGKALQSGDMMLQTLSLPKYQDWAYYEQWLGMNGARIMLEMMMGY